MNVIEKGFHPKLALGNGYLGMRGCPEEGEPMPKMPLSSMASTKGVSQEQARRRDPLRVGSPRGGTRHAHRSVRVIGAARALRMRLRCANSISTFLCSRRNTRPSQDLAISRAISGAPSWIERDTLRSKSFG
jgi:hypothetical protein